MKHIWYLEDVNLFKILCPHKYAAYKDSHEFEIYNKKDFIYFTEDTSDKIYLIDKGKVKIGYYTEDGREVVKAILTRGEIFGEKSILGETRHNDFAQTLEPKTSICSMSVNEMQNLMLENRSLSLKIYKFIGLRIKRLERRLELLLFKDARTRLIEFLNEMESDFGTKLATGDVLIKNPYTQKDMASLLGISRPSLNILMNELKDEGYLSFGRRK
jgi:CRP-like cAMP-binding protein